MFIPGGCPNHQTASELNFSPLVQTTLLCKSTKYSVEGMEKRRGGELPMLLQYQKAGLKPCCSHSYIFAVKWNFFKTKH